MRLALGKIEARVRLAHVHGFIRPELWIGDERVPASPEGTTREKAPQGASCEVHPRPAEPYRASDGERKAPFRCVACRRAICSACTAVDRALCQRCFDAALLEEDWVRDAHHRTRQLRFGVAALSAGALILYATVSWRLWAAMALGVLVAGGGAALLTFASRGRKPRPARVWSAPLVLRPLHEDTLGSPVLVEERN